MLTAGELWLIVLSRIINIEFGMCAYTYNTFSGPVSGEITKISIPVYGNEDDPNFDSLTPTVTDFVAKPDYSFSYGVEDPDTGNSQAHYQSREGDVVYGQYSLIEPDGFLRKVVYTSDPKNGFHATVHYLPLDELPHSTESYGHERFPDVRDFPSISSDVESPSFSFSQNRVPLSDDYFPDSNFDNIEKPAFPVSQSHVTLYNTAEDIDDPNNIPDYDSSKDPKELAESLVPNLPYTANNELVPNVQNTPKNDLVSNGPYPAKNGLVPNRPYTAKNNLVRNRPYTAKNNLASNRPYTPKNDAPPFVNSYYHRGITNFDKSDIFDKDDDTDYAPIPPFSELKDAEDVDETNEHKNKEDAVEEDEEEEDDDDMP